MEYYYNQITIQDGDESLIQLDTKTGKVEVAFVQKHDGQLKTVEQDYRKPRILIYPMLINKIRENYSAYLEGKKIVESKIAAGSDNLVLSIGCGKCTAISTKDKIKDFPGVHILQVWISALNSLTNKISKIDDAQYRKTLIEIQIDDLIIPRGEANFVPSKNVVGEIGYQKHIEILRAQLQSEQNIIDELSR